MAWRNRIAGYGEEPPDQLLANPFNFRIHSLRQKQAMAGTLDQIGWIDEVIVNKRTGHVIDGHMRVQIALSEGEGMVPVKYVDLDPDEEAQALAEFDYIGSLAAVDAEKLTELLANVPMPDNEAVAALFADMRERYGADGSFLPATETGARYETDNYNADYAERREEAGLAHQLKRDILLRLSFAEHREVMDAAEFLGTVFGTETVTDTLVQAIRFAYQAHSERLESSNAATD